MKTLLAIFILGFTTNIQAISPYLGIDYFKSDLNIAGQKTKPTMTSTRAGVFIWPQIAIETQFYQSKSTDNIYRLDVEMKESKAIYAKFVSRDYDDITMDITLGYASTELAVEGPAGTYNGTDTYEGFSWGIAAEQKLRSLPNTSFRLAYTSLYEDDSLHIRGFSVGFTYNF